MSTNQEYPHSAWSLPGETSAQPMHQYPSSPRNSPHPHPWHAGFYNYQPFANTPANNLVSAAAQPLPPRGNGYNADAPPHPRARGMLSDILKRILSDGIAHADSEVMGFHKEACGPGRSRVIVMFETSDEI